MDESTTEIITQFKTDLQEINQITAENKLPPLQIKYDEPINLSDFGNAERLVKRHGLNVHYCYPWNCWLVWDGYRWIKDETGAINRYAKEVVRSIYTEASIVTDDKTRKDLVKFALRSESQNHIKAVVNLAQSEPGIPITPDRLDRDPMILNVLNGSVDLRTGELLPHCRENLITKIAKVEYSPITQCPEWEKFLNRIMAGNENLISFLQMAIGYSLTGDTREQCLFFLYGCGANGKSTFLNTILALLGDYAQQTPVNTLMIKQGEAIPNDIARLKGARFVVGMEIEEGKKLAESMVKQLTGGDIMTARFMRAEWFEFRPEFKIFLGTNHKPEIRGNDIGIWRRIRLIPFNVCIPASEQDKTLPDKLKAELPGILNWAIAGCLAWQKEGLTMPEEVVEAIEEYRCEMDHLSAYFKEKCQFNSDSRILASSLSENYFAWCRDNQLEAVNPKVFAARLKEQGCIPIKMGAMSQRGWKGISLMSVMSGKNGVMSVA
jgi:putative DNA primase/helicase